MRSFVFSNLKQIKFYLFHTLMSLILTSCNNGCSSNYKDQSSSNNSDSFGLPNTNNPGVSDFPTRCSQPGVIKCVNFDTDSDFDHGIGGTNGAFGSNSGIIPPSGTDDYTRAVRDTQYKASGDSSLRFTIPSNSGADTSGAYFTNFSKDLSLQIDEGEEFYVQWRQRFSPEFIETQYDGAGGFKQIIVGTGDKPGTTPYSSCSALELPLYNHLQKGFPVMYAKQW